MYMNYELQGICIVIASDSDSDNPSGTYLLWVPYRIPSNRTPGGSIFQRVRRGGFY